ncbi:single-stranded DNA-binding protein [Tetragenococcus halophilus]|uniref:Single-stranded DNA-binding protein n=1 Tax=Tetragenococcus halophilus (strain DSM 20338 / JCM 20259 / NCIMB 9735 / NBRC 12172) TaxID=945021 RepID=A0AAN1SIQ5_TETHN|nr:single-stranded DNA-binding protein [Tetragenococcus halophilus]BAK95159.1 single-stranded DNA-binding protein [Tetragenococcus halophilus NBRC 12172]GBD71095.1 single-stranded DNA-binding protein [Tetragenococcus halophilus subsp. halophilus]
MINNVVLVGRLTKDPDLRYTQSGTAVANFTLAVNRTFTNQDGEREADFINCVIWRKAAENLANMVGKGAQIGVTGRIQTRNYENKEGQRVFVVEVVAENFQMLESRNKQNGQNNANTGASNNNANEHSRNQQNSTQSNTDPFGGSSIDVTDDSLPF